MQKTLFDDERPAKLARDSDPETSHDAAAEMLPKLSELECRLYDEFHNIGSMTANEAAQSALRTASAEPYVVRNKLNHETLRKRYTGLLAKSRIESNGKKQCRITGKLATVYRIKDE